MTILICFVRSLRCLFVACLLLPGAMLYANTPPTAGAGATRNPDLEQRILSPGNTAYYVDPIGGDDNRSGLRADQAWRTFDQINSRSFAPGDRIEILRPGIFGETLMPQGTGSADSPVEIHFAAGRYDFYPSNALKLKLYISNDNDAPGSPKAIAMLFKNTRHFHVSGRFSNFYIHGKMIEAMLDHAEDVTFNNLSFDYDRPTVSEFTVTAVAADHADVQIQHDSAYAIVDGKLVWQGEGWKSQGLGLSQEADPADGRLWRRDSPLGDITKVDELALGRLRLFFNRNPGFIPGHVFQFREIFRDYVGVFILRSRNITWQDCNFYFLHGLGIVSQFSENLTFDHVAIAPRPGSDRTCAGWADLLHFSGCRGLIKIHECKMAGMNDDAVNIHGTYLRVVGRPRPDQVLLRFMHPQSYGFEAFSPGDEIELVSHISLCAYQSNKVKTVEVISDKEVLLTLEETLPQKVGDDDVIENVTWTPSVEITGCTVALDSCRGFLVSTLRPVMITSNTFIKTAMSAILIADDANSWYESGEVRDVLIQNNQFTKCAEPVVAVAPENRSSSTNEPVHQNIRIINNHFDLIGQNAVTARSVDRLLIEGNYFSSAQLPVRFTACTRVRITQNKLGALAKLANVPPSGLHDY